LESGNFVSLDATRIVIDELRVERAAALALHGNLDAAIASSAVAPRIDISLSEALVLGLIRQDVRTFVTVLGHGSTDIGEVLRVYADAGVVRVFDVRHETEASHAATALRWTTGEKAAIVTSIGPGALHAMAGSLVASSNGIGVWHIYGDETTEDEGPNLQQISKNQQHNYLHLVSVLGGAYLLHTPEAIGTALRRGANVVGHPYRSGPFFILMPLNTQPAMLEGFNLRELPYCEQAVAGPAVDLGGYEKALEMLDQAKNVVVRVGGGAKESSEELLDLLELTDGVAVISPAVQGVIPFSHPRNMTVGGSKGSISGNYAMQHADTLIVVGSRSVCQSDCSRTGYPNVRRVININTDFDDATHYADTVALVGDAASTLAILNDRLRAKSPRNEEQRSEWLQRCHEQRKRWEDYKAERIQTPVLFDSVWKKEVLTQPAAISTVLTWTRAQELVTYIDSGDVQAYAFQMCPDDSYGRTITETGSSYMGFAPSAILATAMAKEKFYGVALCGDGSFTMAPQILIDGVQHGARGCLVVLDNRRMGAISSLQRAQYGRDFATSSTVDIDFLRWAGSVEGIQVLAGGETTASLLKALEKAHSYDGLSFVHVPVYFGDDPMGSLESFGGWNVGRWVGEIQSERHRIGL
jgi:3D-(3,5/4)-trihydroxycyclohexane-1,2-dione acylhydrolase (decyclizing)